MTLKPYVISQEMAQILSLQSSDISKKRMLLEGDSIFNMAHREYKDPTMWRSIAKKNDLENPLFIKPGTTLLLPSKEEDKGVS
jgi:prophage DNA circulation protein